MGACLSKKKKEEPKVIPKKKVFKRWNVTLDVIRLSTFYGTAFQIGEHIEFNEHGMRTSERYCHDGQVIFGRGNFDWAKDVYFDVGDRYCSK